MRVRAGGLRARNRWPRLFLWYDNLGGWLGVRARAEDLWVTNSWPRLFLWVGVSGVFSLGTICAGLSLRISTRARWSWGEVSGLPLWGDSCRLSRSCGFLSLVERVSPVKESTSSEWYVVLRLNLRLCRTLSDSSAVPAPVGCLECSPHSTGANFATSSPISDRDGRSSLLAVSSLLGSRLESVE